MKLLSICLGGLAFMAGANLHAGPVPPNYTCNDYFNPSTPERGKEAHRFLRTQCAGGSKADFLAQIPNFYELAYPGLGMVCGNWGKVYDNIVEGGYPLDGANCNFSENLTMWSFWGVPDGCSVWYRVFPTARLYHYHKNVPTAQWKPLSAAEQTCLRELQKISDCKVDPDVDPAPFYFEDGNHGNRSLYLCNSCYRRDPTGTTNVTALKGLLGRGPASMENYGLFKNFCKVPTPGLDNPSTTIDGRILPPPFNGN